MIFSVRFIKENGDPIANKNVKLYESGLLGMTRHSFTDDDGWAEFEIYSDSPVSIGQVAVETSLLGDAFFDCELYFEDGDAGSVTATDEQLYG